MHVCLLIAAPARLHNLVLPWQGRARTEVLLCRASPWSALKKDMCNTFVYCSVCSFSNPLKGGGLGMCVLVPLISSYIHDILAQARLVGVEPFCFSHPPPKRPEGRGDLVPPVPPSRDTPPVAAPCGLRGSVSTRLGRDAVSDSGRGYGLICFLPRCGGGLL